MSPPVLHTPRCMITIMARDDAEWLNTLLNDEAVNTYIEGIRPFAKSVMNTSEFIDGMLDINNNGKGFLWKVMQREKPVGFICTIDFDDNPSLCYALEKPYRKKGLMSEALKAVLIHQSLIMDKKYYVEINSKNLDSYNLCKKLIRAFDIIIQSY